MKTSKQHHTQHHTLTTRLLTAIALLLIAAMPLHAAKPTLTVSLDSVQLLMGHTTPMHITLVADQTDQGQITFGPDTMATAVEINRILPPDTTQLGNGRIEIKQTILLQSFDSGVYRLQPVRYITSTDTAISDRLALKVMPIAVDTLTTVHPFAPVADIDRHLIDYLPDLIVNHWKTILGILLLAAALTAIYIWRKRIVKNPGRDKQIPLLPPYDEAIQALNQLKASDLWQTGQERQYYTRLTDILRRYLQRQFQINAMEMTTTEIMRQMRSNPTTKPSQTLIDKILTMADFVKFAKVRPLPEENTAVMNHALQFVDDTKPIAEPTPDPDESQTHNP